LGNICGKKRKIKNKILSLETFDGKECSEKSEEKNEFLEDNVGKSNENNEAKEEKEVVLKVAHVEPETRSTNRALLIFKEEVEEATKGSIKIEIYFRLYKIISWIYFKR